jgi:thioredoxin 1
MPQDTHTGALIEVTDATFAETVLANDLPVLVDFWAQWCPPCHAITKPLGELAEEFRGRMVIVKLNSDENPVTARAYRVLSLPTLLIFRGGEVVASMVGARPKSALRNALEPHANP